jgi:hypothetical protein
MPIWCDWNHQPSKRPGEGYYSPIWSKYLQVAQVALFDQKMWLCLHIFLALFTVCTSCNLAWSLQLSNSYWFSTICRLPVPRPGQVLGLVGTNGIGKSTALKVLAGKLKPNLGRFKVYINTCSCLISFSFIGSKLPCSKKIHFLFYVSYKDEILPLQFCRTHQIGRKSLHTFVALNFRTTSPAYWKITWRCFSANF